MRRSGEFDALGTGPDASAACPLLYGLATGSICSVWRGIAPSRVSTTSVRIEEDDHEYVDRSDWCHCTGWLGLCIQVSEDEEISVGLAGARSV